MKPFVAPLDDILFSLNHVAGATALDAWDTEFAAEIGGHFASFAEGEIAPLNESGDLEGCQLVDGRVVMPKGFKELYQSYSEQGWAGLNIPEDYDGQGMDALMLAITSEIFSGANQSLQMVTGLVPGAARTILKFGTDAQKTNLIPPLASGEMLATMCLTEPGAGSDLGRVRCRAAQSGDSWKITGEKIFISGGDQDMSARILHLVLARTSDDGIKGLSLFLCPCTREDGSRNAVSVTRIEEKMGLHASPTCQLAFDDADAELIGEQGRGLAAMFTMMNHARGDVALQGVAHAARAHDIASDYAGERVQGRNADGSPATLNQHADVRRILDEIDAAALGSRAMTHLAFVQMERGDNPAFVEFLTPIIKVYCTEAGMRGAEMGMQVLGGYGYLQEYLLDQTYRDIRISAIYEGANAIHERGLATRLLGGASGDAFDTFLADELDAAKGVGNIAQCAELWRTARAALLATDDASPHAHHFMALTAQTLLNCLWVRTLAVADQHPDTARITRIANAQLNANLHQARLHAAFLAD